MQTYQKTKINNLLGLGEFTTAEMFALQPNIGDILFNTTIQSIVQFTNEGWKDLSGNPVLNRLLFEDFETDFANWVLVNDTLNYFIVGNATAYKGLKSAYITNNNLAAQYTNNQTQISHFYKDILLPNAATIKLTFFWKAVGELNFDYGRIYVMPTTVTPQARVLPSSAYDVSGQLNNSQNWQKKEIDLSAYKNTTIRLVFTWRNDGSVGTNPAICFDNVLIEYL